MDVNFVLLLCIALIFAAHTTNKVDGEAQAFSSSETGFGGSEIVTNVTESKSRRDNFKNTTDDTQLGDGSKTKGSDSKSEGKEGVDEAMSNSSKKIAKGFTVNCTDEEDQFVACLRVPGNDAPHLSLDSEQRQRCFACNYNCSGFCSVRKEQS